MARSRTSLWLFCLALAPLAALADTGTTPATTPATAPGATPAPPTASASAQPLLINPKEQYDFAAASCDITKSQGTVCRSIVLSQGNTKVRADEAQFTCMNCQNSHWKLQGNVRIDAQPRGDLRSDQAIVEVRDNRIVRATVTGKPAEFEQQLADDLGMEKGRADQIVYDVDAGTVLLTNDAWVSKGGDQMSAPSISYSIRQQRVLATSGSASQQVHITITPQSLQKRGSPPQSPQKGKAPAGSPGAASTPPTPTPKPAHPSGTGAEPAPPPPGHT
jgi:lipopolysaccharide transport protein LptA